jgi:hypothetical protein
VCDCCGEGTYEFLSIDHVNGDGGAHRKQIGRGSLYTWLKRNDWPSGFRVLCHNCNQAIGHYGVCPHVGGSRGFSLPPKRNDVVCGKVRSAAESLVKDGIYPSIAKVSSKSGFRRGVVMHWRKKLLESGDWPAQSDALAVNRRFRPDIYNTKEK